VGATRPGERHPHPARRRQPRRRLRAAPLPSPLYPPDLPRPCARPAPPLCRRPTPTPDAARVWYEARTLMSVRREFGCNNCCLC
jgi:hypothetical protein